MMSLRPPKDNHDLLLTTENVNDFAVTSKYFTISPRTRGDRKESIWEVVARSQISQFCGDQ